MLEVSDEVVRCSTPLGAGLGYSQNMCGALIAAALALGVKYGRIDLQISRRPSWSRGYRLVECFVKRYQTVSCAELTAGFKDFCSPARIAHCMRIIAFATQEAANFLLDRDESYSDPTKEEYFARREKKKSP